jgi:hypothetical protein
MELDLQSLVVPYSLAETRQLSPSPRIWADIRGWSAKVTSLCNPLQYIYRSQLECQREAFDTKKCFSKSLTELSESEALIEILFIYYASVQ